MKYIISESKIESVIREYLDDNYYPDYGWLEPEVYKEEFEGACKVSEVEDFEADAEDIEFKIPGGEDAKPVVDKELNKSLSKQDKIIKQWQNINAQMKSALYAYKNADTDEAKETSKISLKKLTPAYRAAKDAYEKLKGVKL